MGGRGRGSSNNHSELPVVGSSPGVDHQVVANNQIGDMKEMFGSFLVTFDKRFEMFEANSKLNTRVEKLESEVFDLKQAKDVTSKHNHELLSEN